MLKTIDRIQIATPDAAETARGWVSLLGAKFDSEDHVDVLGAKRVTYRLGSSTIEFLEPDGAGQVEKALAKRGRAHLLTGGVSTTDFDAAVERVRSKGVEVSVENGQAYFNAEAAIGADSPIVMSPYVELEKVGDADYLYEVTLLTEDAKDTTARFADLFDLDTSNFTDIESKDFGYNGVLTKFAAKALHRFEIITPFAEKKTMRRFLDRSGPGYYMSFVEASDLLLVEQRATTQDAPLTINRPDDRDPSKTADEMWLHPAALGGVMLGISRPSMAWRWSGHPDWVQAVE